MIYCEDIKHREDRFSKVYKGNELRLDTDFSERLRNGYFYIKLKSNTGTWKFSSPDVWNITLTDAEGKEYTYKFSLNIEYSENNGQTWSRLYGNTEHNIIGKGHKVYFRKGQLEQKFYGSWISGGSLLPSIIVDGEEPETYDGVHFEFLNGQFEVGGDLVKSFGEYGGDKQGVSHDIYTSTSRYEGFFYNQKNLVSAKNLKLNSNKNVAGLYEHMFYNCSNLTESPKTIVQDGNGYMTCYCMFKGCTSLIKSPSIEFTTYTETTSNALRFFHTFHGMFMGCTGLEYIGDEKELNYNMGTDSIGYNFYKMFYGCNKLKESYSNINSDAGENDFAYMYYGCSSLNSSPSMSISINTIKTGQFKYMFSSSGVSSISLDLSEQETTPAMYEGMFSYCSKLKTADIKLKEINKISQCNEMFRNCSNLESATIRTIGNIEGASESNHSTVDNLFRGCSKLNNIKLLSTNGYINHYTTDSSNYASFSNAFNGVSSEGTLTAYRDNSGSYWKSFNGLPDGWTIK